MSSPDKKHKPNVHKKSGNAAQPVPMSDTSLDRARRLNYAALVLDEVHERPSHAEPASKAAADLIAKRRARAEATRHARLLLHYTQN